MHHKTPRLRRSGEAHQAATFAENECARDIFLHGNHRVGSHLGKCRTTSGTATSKHSRYADCGDGFSLRQIRISLSRRQHATCYSGPAGKHSESRILVWLDTVNVSYSSSVDLVMDFTDPIIRGMSLFHCHLLNQEDKGMMAKVLFR